MQPIESPYTGWSSGNLLSTLRKIGSAVTPLTILITVQLLLSGCGSSSNNADNGKLNVVATTGQIADGLSNIAGDAINLTGLLGPGVDPHLYVPTEGNVSDFSEADLVVYNGLDLEAQMSRVLEQMEGRGVSVLAVGDALPEGELLNWDAQYPNDPPHLGRSDPLVKSH